MSLATKRRKQKISRYVRSGRVERSWAALHWTSWLLVAVIFFFAAVRFHWRDIPLERDEGEYAYSGQLMLRGIPPYRLAYSMKLPGTYAAYALMISVFGQTSGGVHLGFLVVNVATTLLVFLLGRKLFTSAVGAISGIAYIVLSASSSVLGLAAHATHFVVLAALAGILLLLQGLDSDRAMLFFWSGTCLGLAFLMKQPGIVFSLFAFAYWAYRKWNRIKEWRYSASTGGALLVGTLWPYGLTCLLLYWAGVFPRFWFWTFTYARAYGNYVPGYAALRNLGDGLKRLLDFDWGIWLIVGIGFVVLLLNRRCRVHAAFVAGLLAFSFMGVSAGLYFREHYFVMLLPAAALLCGVAVVHAIDTLPERQSGAMAIAVPAAFVLAVGISILREHAVFFAPNTTVASRRIYPNDPFVEAHAVADYLKSHTDPDTRVAIFGSEPEIYFDSQRRSATGFIYMYPLMEQQKYAIEMRQEMLQEVIDVRPEYVLFVDDQRSWLWFSPSWQQEFFQSVLHYIHDGYEMEAKVNIVGNADHGIGDAAAIYVFHRKVQ